MFSKVGSFLCICFVFLCVFAQGVQAQSTTPMSVQVDKKIIIILDESFSMSSDVNRRTTKVESGTLTAYTWQIQGYVDAMKDPRVIAAISEGKHKRIAVCIIGFATTASVRLDWTIIEGDNVRQLSDIFNSFHENIHKIRNSNTGTSDTLGSKTNIGTGLSLAKDKIISSPHIQAEQTIILLSGDGKQLDERGTIPPYPLSEEIAEYLKVTIIGVYIDTFSTYNSAEEELASLGAYYYTNVTKGVGSFVFFANHKNAFRDVMLKLFKLRREH